MPRSHKEWVGKSDDTPVPPRVRLRVFERHGGVCHASNRKILPGERWECDHVTALINGGENRENNLAPILASKHTEKTAKDVAEKAKVARIAKKHLGISKPKRSGFQTNRNGKYKMKMNGRVVERDTPPPPETTE